MARPVLGVAVQRQIWEHDAKALSQRRHDRLELAVGEPQGVEQYEGGASSGLAIGDPGTVMVVIEAQPHLPGSSHPGGLGGRGSTVSTDER